MHLCLEKKIEHSRQTIKETLVRFSYNLLYVSWSGGKDSTTLLWLYKDVCKEIGKSVPRAIFIDDGFVFDEAIELVNKVKKKWGVEVTVLKNIDVSGRAKKQGDLIKVEELNERNRKEVAKIGFTETSFPFEPESFLCSHLMKTVAMNDFIKENNVKAISTAIRWDEHKARAYENFSSLRFNPEHIRIHPIIHLSEQDIWSVINANDIPFCSLYAQDYRSLGAKNATTKISDKPAWEQNLEDDLERIGRNQEKEEIIKRLRDLGYM